MQSTYLVRAALGLLAASLLLAGCGDNPDHDAPSGSTVSQDGIAYTVLTSRALDPFESDDRAVLDGVRDPGRLEAPDITLLGVFLQASDQASSPRRAMAAPRLATAFGRTFKPLHLPASNELAYGGGRLAPGDQLPGGDSPASEGSEGGAALVYEVPTDVFLTDRPFTLRFGTSRRAASVQLDL